MTPYAYQRSVDFVDSWLGYKARQAILPGFAVAVYYRGEIFMGAYGYANIAIQERLTTDYRFQIGSQSKMLTAAAILRLAERGDLKLDDTAVTYVPWLGEHEDERFAAVTLRQLLNHEAGIARDGYPTDFWQLQGAFPDEQKLRQIILDSVFHAAAGVRFKYSNLGYALLGLIVQAVSGLTYVECVRDLVLQPLGLDGIQSYDDGLSASVAMGYLRPTNGYRLPVSVTVPTHAFAPVAGWFARPQDMCRFLVSEIQARTGLGKEFWQTRHQHWRPYEWRGTSYNLGLMTHRCGSYEVVGHTGSFIGHSSYGFYEPKQDLAVVVMANAKDAPVHQIGDGIFGVFEYFATSVDQPLSPAHERLNVRLMNMWQTVEVVATGDRVVVIDPDSWAPFEDIVEELVPIGPTKFKIQHTHDLALLDEEVTFHFDTEDVVGWVDYSGSTTVPEERYLWWLNNQKHRSDI